MKKILAVMFLLVALATSAFAYQYKVVVKAGSGYGIAFTSKEDVMDYEAEPQIFEYGGEEEFILDTEDKFAVIQIIPAHITAQFEVEIYFLDKRGRVINKKNPQVVRFCGAYMGIEVQHISTIR